MYIIPNSTIPNQLELCAIAKSFSQDVVYKFVIMFKFFLCLLASAASMYLIMKKGTKWILNLNARLIYGCHLAFSLFLPITSIYSYSYDIYRLFFLHSSNDCDYAINSSISMHARLPSVLGMAGEMSTLLFLSIERTISTIFPKRYEQLDKSTLGMLFTTLSVCQFRMFSKDFCILKIVLAIGLSYGLILPGAYNNMLVASFSTRRMENYSRFQIFTLLHFCGQILSISILCWAFYRNNLNHLAFPKSCTAEVGTRYQICENRKVISLLLPTSIANTCVLSINLSATAVFSFIFEHNLRQYIIMSELVFIAPLYSFILPIIIHFQLKDVGVVLNTTMKQEEYFKELRSYFDSNIVQPVKS